MVFEKTVYPQMNAFHGFLAGGDLQEIKRFDGGLVDAARALDCARITVTGRRGWVRALRDIGYVERWSTVAKDV